MQDAINSSELPSNVKLVFLEALELCSEDRETYLNKIYRDNRAKTEELLTLLDWHDKSGNFLSKTIIELLENEVSPS